MLPTLEEFGVRRPMEIPLGQTGPTNAGVEWPMMSRTMTHVRRFLSFGQEAPYVPTHLSLVRRVHGVLGVVLVQSGAVWLGVLLCSVVRCGEKW
jgi:hypothetical protein